MAQLQQCFSLLTLGWGHISHKPYKLFSRWAEQPLCEEWQPTRFKESMSLTMVQRPNIWRFPKTCPRDKPPREKRGGCYALLSSPVLFWVILHFYSQILYNWSSLLGWSLNVAASQIKTTSVPRAIKTKLELRHKAKCLSAFYFLLLFFMCQFHQDFRL